MADTSGNIAYMLTSASPVRKNEYPYLGCRVLDGTTTKHDHVDIIDFQHLPFAINPKKGYFVTANGRIVPPNSKFDVGAALTDSPRAVRIREILEEGIGNGTKFTPADMQRIQ
jgi:penicillin amidase